LTPYRPSQPLLNMRSSFGAKMLYDEDFIGTIRSNPVAGVLNICNAAFAKLEETSDPEGWNDDDYQILCEAYALCCEMVSNELIHIPQRMHIPDVRGNIAEDCPELQKFLIDIQREYSCHASKTKFEDMRSHFKMSLGGAFSYEFSQGDLTRIQELVNQLRDEISASTRFEKEHQQRLLRRLEKIQSELHKKVSDLDRFWGLIGDAGVVLGKLGTDAKPLVERIKEIASIVWQTQSRAEELPSGTPTPLLENTDKNRKM